MMRTFYASNERRGGAQTAKPMFRRIDPNHNSQQSRISRTSKQSHRNFPSLNKSQIRSMNKTFNRGMSLDNSKENVLFESFLHKVSSANKIDEKSIVSNYLNTLRKDYDRMFKETKQQMSSINLKKKDIDFIKDRIKVQQESIQTLQKNIQAKNKEMEKMELKHSQAQTQRKTLNQIIYRMKKDQIFYKQFGRVFQGEIVEKKKKLKAIKQGVLFEDQRIHKLIVNIEQMKDHYVKNQQFRQRKLQDYCQKIQNINEKDAFIQQRKQRTMQLQGIQSNDILRAKKIQMRNICLINKVADCIFQTKLQKLIAKYSDVQDAFHTIQVKTSISDPNLIASKFFSYEELTQNLLSSISTYQKQLEEKQERNRRLKAQQRQLENNQYFDSMEDIKNSTDRISHQCSDQIIQKHLSYQKIKQWIDRTSKKLKIFSNESIEDNAKKLTQICMKTKTQIQQLEKQSGENCLYERKYVSSGIRIKKIIKQSTIDAKTQKIKQVQELKQCISAEDDYLKAARAGVKRNFLIKQKTVNVGNLLAIREARNENISDRSVTKTRASDNR